MPAVRAPLAEALGRVLRETVCAPEDLPPVDRSTRDGYAIRADDASKTFSVVDTIHAADWKPRQLKPGEAVRVATGAALPCDGLRVVMQEHVERDGDKLRVLRREISTNVRLRGEEVRQGQPLVPAGTKLNAGALAILATAGNANPSVSPRLRIVHFTTGDEIVPPDQMPKPGQIRDSNSILIRGLLQNFPCDLEQSHLPENFEAAKSATPHFGTPHSATRTCCWFPAGQAWAKKISPAPLLERLGFEIVFSQINLRPGRPLIFGVNGPRVAFGLPGNPLSHFVCFHFAVATALAGLTGGEPPEFLRGQLAEKLDDKPCPRETLWPARWEWNDATPRLRPLAWASSGDITCLAAANALVRVPANSAAGCRDIGGGFFAGGGYAGKRIANQAARRRAAASVAGTALPPLPQTEMKKTFSHLDAAGGARMVNVGHKPVQRRRAVAEGRLVCAPATIRALKKNALPKGDVLTVAQIAGIQAAKRTAELIPLVSSAGA